jgi:hypothetical protein
MESGWRRKVSLRKEVSDMQKLLVVLAAVVMMVSFSVVGNASTQNMVGTMGASHGAMMGAEHQTMVSGRTRGGPGEVDAGEVAWVDPEIHTMMVNGRDGSKIFDVSGIAVKSLPGIDHFVTVKYTVTNGDRLVSSVNTVSPRVFTALYVGDF